MKLCSDVPIVDCVDTWSFVTVFVLSLKEIFYLFWCRLSILTESTVTAYSIIFMCSYSYFSTYWIHWNYWYVWNFFSTITSFSGTRETPLVCLIPLILVIYLVTLNETNCILYNQLQWNQTNPPGLSGSTVTGYRSKASYSENSIGHITSYSGIRQTRGVCLDSLILLISADTVILA